jgi:hypothetical protein
MASLAAVVIAMAASAFAAAPASANVTISSYTLQPSSLQAGGHPNLAINAAFSYSFLSLDSIKDMTIGFAPGLLAAPANVPNCSQTQLSNNSCPSSSQVGTGTMTATTLGLVTLSLPATVYQMPPANGNEFTHYGIAVNVAILGLNILSIDVQVGAVLRTAPTVGANLVSTGLPDNVLGIVPIQVNALSLTINGTVGGKAYTRAPTVCTQVTSTLAVDSYNNPSTTVNASNSFTPTGCGSLGFSPSIAASLTPDSGDPGVALSTTINLGASDAALSGAVLTFPSAVSPNIVTIGNATANGCSQTTLSSCQVVGTGTVTTPLITTPLAATVYLVGHPHALPSFAIVLGAPANLTLNASLALIAGGAFQASLTGIPDFPLSQFKLNITGGANGLLQASPTVGCANSVTAALSAQNNAHANVSAPLVINGSVPVCPPPYTGPRGSTGSGNGPNGFSVSSFQINPSTTAAGGHPDLYANASFGYGDAGDSVKDVTVTLPPGVGANPTAATATCSPTQLAANACPAASQIGGGSVVANVSGAGGAISGTQNLNAALYLMPAQNSSQFVVIGITASLGTAEVFSTSAPATLNSAGEVVLTFTGIPNGVTLFTGTPSQLSATAQILSLNLKFNGTVDGNPFTTAPTSCNVATGTLTADSYESAPGTATASSSYTPTGCPLPYSPHISASLSLASGSVGANATLTSTLTQNAGDSATKNVVLTVPGAVSPSLAVVGAATGNGCAETALAQCQIVGTVSAVTPLLSTPLQGNIYLVGHANALPSLAIVLGAPANLTLDASLALVDGGAFQASLTNLPDFPISSLAITLGGAGSNASLLTASPNVGCAAALGASLTPQDGGTPLALSVNPLPVSVSGGGTVPACPVAPPANVGSVGASTPANGFALSSFQLSPATAQASAAGAPYSPNLTSNITFSYANTTDSVNNLVVNVGSGLLVNPNAASARCQPTDLANDACPAASQVGQGTAQALVNGAGGSISGVQPLTLALYQLPAQSAAEFGRLGVVARLGNASVFSAQAPVTLDQSGQMTLTFNGLPNSTTLFAGTQSQITVAAQLQSFSLTFDGTVDGNPFTFAPAQCVDTPTVATAVSYAGSDSVTASSDYTPTGCPPNSEQADGGSTGVGGPLADGTGSMFTLLPSDTTVSANPDLTSVMTFTYRDSNAAVGGPAHCASLLAANSAARCDALSTVTVDLAPGLLANPETIAPADQCTPAQLQANACPATSQVAFGGTSSATYDENGDGNYGQQSSLATNVYLMPAQSSSELAELGLIVYLHGNPVATVTGSAKINSNGQVQLSFANLPTQAAIGNLGTEVYVQVNRIVLNFYGTTNQDGAIGTALPFTTNPSGCTAATSTAVSTTVQQPSPVSASSTFIPTSNTPGTPAGC